MSFQLSPPSSTTLIARESENAEVLASPKDTLKRVNTLISDANFDKTQSWLDFLRAVDTTEEELTDALKITKRGTQVMLKRDVGDISVNSYNPAILKTWKANMDLQYIVDAYACVMYIASYVLKSERTMGDLLKRVSKEVANEDVRTQLKKL